MELANTHLIFCLILTLYICFRGVRCECNADGNSVQFKAIDPANYTMEYASITDQDKRPYGFQKAIWLYNQPSSENPCVSVNGASKRRVEVMVEAVPPSRICVRTQNIELGCSDDGIGRLFSCRLARSDTVYFEFYCDKRCMEQDVQFWYRIVLGVTTDLDPEDHWCNERSQDEYPESLRQLPIGFDFAPDTTTPFNHSPSTRSCVLLMFLLCALVSILL